MDLYEEIVRLRSLGQRAALATIVRQRGSTPRKDHAKMLVRQDGSFLGTIGGGCTEAEVWQAAQQVLQDEKAVTLSFDLTQEDAAEDGLVCGGTLEVYVEPILPDPHLYIFGAGHIGYWVSRLAKDCGFRVTVVDDRARFANSERYAHADRVLVLEFDGCMQSLPIDSNSYILVVTRGHAHDQAVLHQAIQTPARMVSMVGSSRKTRLICDFFESLEIPAERWAGIHAPAGFDIGAETPEEIAVAIVAEMIAVRKGKAVGRTSGKKLPVREFIPRNA